MINYKINKMFMNEAGAGGGSADKKISYTMVENACTTIDNCLSNIQNYCNMGIPVTSYKGLATGEIETWIEHLKNDLNQASNIKMQEIRENLSKVKTAYTNWENAVQSGFSKINAQHTNMTK